MLQHRPGGTRSAQWQGCDLGRRGWRAGGPLLLSPAWPQRSRDGRRSHHLPLRLPCEGLEPPRLQREKMNIFLSLCQAGVCQGSWYCCDSCTFLVLNIIFSTSPCAPHCGEGRWGERPAPPSLPALGRPGSPQHGAGRHCSDMGQARVPRARDRQELW